jgi:glycosyltransferase 2 family protein
LKKKVIGLLKFILFLGIGLLITWLSLRNLTPENEHDLKEAFQNLNWFWIVLVLIIGIFSHLFRAWRWQMLLEPIAGRPSLRNTFLAVMTGYFANLAFPRLGEVTRCGVLHTTNQIPVNKSLGTVITERGIDLILFFGLFLLLVVTQYGLLIDYLEANVLAGFEFKATSLGANTVLLLVAAIGMLSVAALVWIVLRAKPNQKFLYKLRAVMFGFRDGVISIAHIRRPWLFVFHSLMIWFCYYLMTWFCFKALDATAMLSAGAGLAVLILGAVGIMITPGGIGLYPLIVRDTLLLYGITATTGFAMGWILWTSQTATIIITGIGSLIWLSTLRRKATEKPLP